MGYRGPRPTPVPAIRGGEEGMALWGPKRHQCALPHAPFAAMPVTTDRPQPRDCLSGRGSRGGGPRASGRGAGGRTSTGRARQGNERVNTTPVTQCLCSAVFHRAPKGVGGLGQRYNRQLPTANCHQPPTANRQRPPTMVEHMSTHGLFWENYMTEHFFFLKDRPVDDKFASYIESWTHLL